MGVISLADEPGADWGVARWAFCGYLEHVRKAVRGDRELEHCIDEAMALDGLHFPLLPGSVVGRLVPVLRRVADEVVEGRRQVQVEGRLLDERAQDQFAQAVLRLRVLLEKYSQVLEAGSS